MRMAPASEDASLWQMLTNPRQRALGSVAFGAGEESSRSPKEKSQSKTFTDAFGVCPQSLGPVPRNDTGNPIPRRTVSLAWTVISPTEFWATHSYTFSSRGVRSGWILSTAPALPSNSIVCVGREERSGPGWGTRGPGRGAGGCTRLCGCPMYIH